MLGQKLLTASGGSFSTTVETNPFEGVTELVYSLYTSSNFTNSNTVVVTQRLETNTTNPASTNIFSRDDGVTWHIINLPSAISTAGPGNFYTTSTNWSGVDGAYYVEWDPITGNEILQSNAIPNYSSGTANYYTPVKAGNNIFFTSDLDVAYFSNNNGQDFTSVVSSGGFYFPIAFNTNNNILIYGFESSGNSNYQYFWQDISTMTTFSNTVLTSNPISNTIVNRNTTIEGNGYFFTAVSNTVSRSVDANSWTTITPDYATLNSNLESTPQTLLYCSNSLLAFTSNTDNSNNTIIYKSTDNGNTWIKTFLPAYPGANSTSWVRIEGYGGNTDSVIVVTDNYTHYNWYSQDAGTTWTIDNNTGNTSSNSYRNITSTSNTIFAENYPVVANSNGSGFKSLNLVSTTDGVTWNKISTPLLVDTYNSSYGGNYDNNSVFRITQLTPGFMFHTTSDGINWTNDYYTGSDPIIYNGIISYTSNNNLLIYIDGGSNVYCTQLGSNRNNVTLAYNESNYHPIRNVKFFSNNFVTVGDTNITTAANGVSYTNPGLVAVFTADVNANNVLTGITVVNTGYVYQPYAEIVDIAFNGSVYAVFDGQGNTVFTTSSLSNLQFTEAGSSNYLAGTDRITGGNGIFICPASSGLYYSTDNGVTWLPCNIPNTITYYRKSPYQPVVKGTRFFCYPILDNTSILQTVIISYDGINWVSVGTNVIANKQIKVNYTSVIAGIIGNKILINSSPYVEILV